MLNTCASLEYGKKLREVIHFSKFKSSTELVLYEHIYVRVHTLIVEERSRVNGTRNISPHEQCPTSTNALESTKRQRADVILFVVG